MKYNNWSIEEKTLKFCDTNEDALCNIYTKNFKNIGKDIILHNVKFLVRCYYEPNTQRFSFIANIFRDKEQIYNSEVINFYNIKEFNHQNNLKLCKDYFVKDDFLKNFIDVFN